MQTGEVAIEITVIIAEASRDFDESDESSIRELAALIGDTLDTIRLAVQPV